MQACGGGPHHILHTAGADVRIATHPTLSATHLRPLRPCRTLPLAHSLPIIWWIGRGSMNLMVWAVEKTLFTHHNVRLSELLLLRLCAFSPGCCCSASVHARAAMGIGAPVRHLRASACPSRCLPILLPHAVQALYYCYAVRVRRSRGAGPG